MINIKDILCYLELLLLIILISIYNTNITSNIKKDLKIKKKIIIEQKKVNKQIEKQTNEKEIINEEINNQTTDFQTENTTIQTNQEQETNIINNETNINQNNNEININQNNNESSFARLYINNYNVALYDYNVYTTSNLDLQTIVNNPDSAAYYNNYNKTVIADHNYQGFNILIYLENGATSQIIQNNGLTTTYKMIYKSKGTNTGPDLIDTNNNSFFDMQSDLIMYTCYENGIMVTLWIKE